MTSESGEQYFQSANGDRNGNRMMGLHEFIWMTGILMAQDQDFWSRQWVKMATGTGWQPPYSINPPAAAASGSGTSPSSTSSHLLYESALTMDYSQDLHLKMSKKIAQLTKVGMIALLKFEGYRLNFDWCLNFNMNTLYSAWCLILIPHRDDALHMAIFWTAVFFSLLQKSVYNPR